MVLIKVPIPSILISTTSPACNVKSFGGTKQVPVIKNTPFGKSHSRNRKPASSVKERFICETVIAPPKTSFPPRFMLSFIIELPSNGAEVT